MAVGIFFLVLAAYSITYNGAFKSNDERALFSGIDSFVQRGQFTTNQIYWDYTHVGVFTTAGDMVPNYEPRRWWRRSRSTCGDALWAPACRG